jgi:hypothetical protein
MTNLVVCPTCSATDSASCAVLVGRFEPDTVPCAFPLAGKWSRSLPTLDRRALHGIAGAWALEAPRYSEASVVGSLVSSLNGFGVATNSGAYWTDGATQHRANEFVVLIGPTGRGRKGLSMAFGLRPILLAEEGFGSRIMGGFGSGEAVVQAVRDPLLGVEEDGSERVLDPGTTDKRLLIREPEFQSVLAVAGREGSTLSSLLRAAWDGEPLANRTKGSQAVATGALVGVLAGITPDELRRRMSEDSRSNGFANRFLHVAVYRSIVRPIPPPIPRSLLVEYQTKFAKAIGKARGLAEVGFTESAAARWNIVYGTQLSVERHGLLDEVCSRAEAHTRRLAMIYALLDGLEAVDAVHLEAALALWRYCEASAKLVYGDRTGSPLADRILDALRRATPDGLSRDQIRSDVLDRNYSAEKIDAALAELDGYALISQETKPPGPSGGRPATVYTARGSWS